MLLDPQSLKAASLKKGVLIDEADYREGRPQGTKTQEEEGTE